MTPGAPAEHAHLRAVDDALRNQVVDARHDVFVALLEIIADDVRLVLLAVIGRAAIVRQQHRVPRTRVSLRAVSAVEAEHVGRCRAAMDGDDQRIPSARLVTNRLDENPADSLAVGRFPADLLLLAERKVTCLRVGVGKLSPVRAHGDLIDRGNREKCRGRVRVGVIQEQQLRVSVLIGIQGCANVRDLAHRILVDVERH